MKIYRGGFTLLEVVIFMSLFTTIFLTITYVNLGSIKNNKLNEHKIMASYYAETLGEWLRGEKDASWSAFLINSDLDDNNSIDYCFNESTLSTWTAGANFFQGQCSNNFALNNIFQREAGFNKIIGGGGETQIEADISVRWYEGPELQQIKLNTILNQYE